MELALELDLELELAHWQQRTLAHCTLHTGTSARARRSFYTRARLGSSESGAILGLRFNIGNR